MTPEEKAMNTAMCLHMSEFIALFFAPFMSITGTRKLPDMRIRGNDCGSAQHGAIVMVSFHDTSLFNSSAGKAAYQPKPSPREFFWRIVACITWKFSKESAN